VVNINPIIKQYDYIETFEKKTEKIMKGLWQICEIEISYRRDGQFLNRHNQKMRVLFLHPEVQIFRDCRPMNFLEYFGFKLKK